MPLFLFIISCAPEEAAVDYHSFLAGKTFESHRYVFEGNEFDDFLVTDYYLEEVPNTILQPGDCVRVFTSFRLKFYNENELDFYRIRNSYRLCNNCSEYEIYDKTEILTPMTFYARENFIVLAGEDGWNPNYYETIYFDEDHLRINKAQPVGDFFSERTRTFHQVPLQEGVLYYVDIYMMAVE